MVDLGDPRAVWLNATNLLLCLVVLTGLVLVGKAVIDELRRKGRKVGSSDADHVCGVGGLGLTMADGGERAAPEKK